MPPPNELFGHDWRVLVGSAEGDTIFGGTVTSELDVQFSVKKSMKVEPNKCDLTIFNLPKNVRQELEELSIYDPKKKKHGSKRGEAKVPKTGHIRVEIEAGYKTSGRSLIFRGDLRRAISTYEQDGTWATKIEGEDGGRTSLASRVSLSFPPGTTRLQVVQQCAAAMGLGLGNILEVQGRLSSTYSSGTVLDGQASKELDGVLRSANLRYSIQNGVLQFAATSPGREVPALLLTPETGLIGLPHRDSSGLVVVEMMMLPNVAPGAYLSVVAPTYKGTLQIERAEYAGDSSGVDWGVKAECYVR
jgi:hypothetical protein